MTGKTAAISSPASPMSEAAAFLDILHWSTGRPNWQRDALRRLILNDASLTELDVDELYAVCIDDTAAFQPLEAKHIAPGSVEGEPIRLLSIKNPVGINALASDQNLKFAPAGLTVVYGDNGSGKSGYVRVLKHACRSRDSKIAILPDINEPKDTPQSAKVGYQRGATAAELDWSPEVADHPHLPSVSIFDAKSANTHLAGEHDVAYTPYPMAVLRALADTCDLLKMKIDLEIRTLKSQRPEAIRSPSLDPNTAAGAFLANLSEKTKPAELEQLTALSEDELRRRTALQADLAGDPKRVVAGLASLRSRLAAQADSLKRLLDATNEAAFTSIAELRAERDSKVALAKAASDELFAASPLPEIGGDLWRALWEAARAYSDQEANTSKSFPEAEPDLDLCVLCQQPLGEPAANRWVTFESFIKGTTKSDEASAVAAYDSSIKAASEKQMKLSSIISLCTLVHDELSDIALADELRACALVASKRLSALRAGKSAPAAQPPFPNSKIDAALAEVDGRIVSLSADASSGIRKELVKELQGLSDRVALNSLKADVSAEMDRCVKIASLKKASKTTAKNAVTTKNKELSDKLVTNALRARFAREIEKLEVMSMPVEMKKEGDRSAQSYFKVALVGKPDEPIGDILSEGEFRCVGLAAFLAELVTSNEYSGIVFDDPMSSLDHLYRRSVAKRLVEEAEHRQVVIFTHDLTFLFEVTRESEEQNRSIAYQTVRRKQLAPGHVEDGLPIKAKQAWPLENGIRSVLKGLKGNFDDKPEAERSVIATGIIAQMRTAWEQGVADFIRPVLARFDSAVKPGSLHKLLVLDESDVKAVQSARSRLSQDVHASPETLNPAEVEHKDLVEELDKLRDWLIHMKEKQLLATKPA